MFLLWIFISTPIAENIAYNDAIEGWLFFLLTSNQIIFY